MKDHFDLLKQKDDLILTLRSNHRQLINDLNKANEILLQSDNKIEHLQNDLFSLENKNKNLYLLIEQEVNKNQVILDYYFFSLLEILNIRKEKVT